MQEIISSLNEIKSLLLLQKRVLTLSQCAQYTGFSESYLYKLTSKKLIPFAKPHGKVIFFDREKIDQWLLQNESTTQEESLSMQRKSSFRQELKDNTL